MSKAEIMTKPSFGRDIKSINMGALYSWAKFCKAPTRRAESKGRILILPPFGVPPSGGQGANQNRSRLKAELQT